MFALAKSLSIPTSQDELKRTSKTKMSYSSSQYSPGTGLPASISLSSSVQLFSVFVTKQGETRVSCSRWWALDFIAVKSL